MSEPQVSPLLDWVLRKHPDTPRGRAKQWILAGRVSVRGVVIRKPHHALSDPGDTLEFGDRQATMLACGSGWQIHPRLALLHLDSAFAIVNKGPGLLAVPAPNCRLSALTILTAFLGGKLQALDSGVTGRSLPPAYRRLRPLAVHRLDQDTSGVLCVACNPVARHILIAQLKAHTMKREYVAFVEGRPRNPQGTWRQELQLSRDELRQYVISEVHPRMAGVKVQEAITYYEVVAEYTVAGGKSFVTQLRLQLETGRKHQIRVQAAYAGLPLIGDRTYNPAYRGPGDNEPRIAFHRQALHAVALSLEHPDHAGRHLTWTAAWPKDLRQLETALRAGSI